MKNVIKGCFILLGAGIFISFPWVSSSTYTAFADIFKLNNEKDEAHHDLLDHLVTD